MYEPSIPLVSDGIYEETKNDASAIHHFYHKLLRLGDYMNTKTAKDMSKIKTDFMKKFAQEFLKEWNAEY